ncbi:hypothetical protein NA57DRAFT_80992 [Rhizodiscina lignyota]|uniref:Mid2 domain-containing protein n=1 Tax=Rhizodiscina lignyota TaxID=1504668 RepID=A0A9P4I533_9PEZI|nr:hypothetical protein NA57DRAFT_80992 [Rhizodiscina lignyota]
MPRVYPKLILLVLLPALIEAACYMPNGTEVPGDSVQPCNQVQNTHSTCCGTNFTKTDLANDICDANGLCQNWVTYPDGRTEKSWYREYCTDQTWNTPFCLKNVCFTNGTEWGKTALSQCSDGTWCCGSDEESTCCQTGSNKFRLAATVGASTSTSTQSTSTTSTPRKTSSTSSASASATSLSRNTSITDGAKAGIAVGVVVGTVALAGFGYLIWRRIKHNSVTSDTLREKGLEPNKSLLPYEIDGNIAPMEADGTPRAEIDGNIARIEADGTPRAELE